MRRGQVALYLVMVLVAICVLVLANVSAYVSVRVKNRAMNAGDAAALAVAKFQGELLNEIGKDNVDHLKAAIENDEQECRDIMRRQARRCFLGPLDGIAVGNEMAQRNGVEDRDLEAEAVLLDHAVEIASYYVENPDMFPPPWQTEEEGEKNPWEEYSQSLADIVAAGLYASPDNIDFIDAAGGHLLLNCQFYNAIAGQNWCWFHFNAPGLLDSYDDYRYWGPLPSASDEKRRQRCVNSEIYSLHLEARTGSAVELFGRDLIKSLTGCSDGDIESSTVITNQSQVWYCYGELWRKWWEMEPDGEWQFPVVGTVKAEYDVRGCAACCRVSLPMPDVLDLNEGVTRVILDDEQDLEDRLRDLGEEDTDKKDAADGETPPDPDAWTNRVCRWTAAAKPFGTVQDEEGVSVVTSLKSKLVVSAFSDVRLVPWDAVGGRDTDRPGLDMVLHVRRHLPVYLLDGTSKLQPGCYYCDQLRKWEDEALRKKAKDWLETNSRSCVRTCVGGTRRGGTPHGH